MNNNKNSRNASRRIAMGGVFGALAVVLMLVGGYLPIATFAAPAFAGLCLIPVFTELGGKAALLTYAGISILSALFVFPVDPEPVLFFILLFGYYPILRPVLHRIKSKLIRYISIFIVFNAALAAIYSFLLFVFVSPALQQEFAGMAPWLIAGLVVVANVTFFIYDILIDKINIIYVHRFRRYFFK